MILNYENFNFTPGIAGVGTITFTTIDIPLNLSHILVIQSITQGKEADLYLSGEPGFGGVLVGKTLTFQVDTTGLVSADIQVILGDIYSPFNRKSETNVQYPLNKGQINKFAIRPKILNEHVESGRSIQATVTATNKVIQVFKASQNNINTIKIKAGSLGGQTIVDSIQQINDAALQLAWVASLGAPLVTLDTGNFSPNLGSTKSMTLPALTALDKWTNTLGTSVDVTLGSISFDFYNRKLGDTYSVELSDGLQVAQVPIGVLVRKVWNTYTIPISSFTAINPLLDITAITSVSFVLTAVGNANYALADNIFLSAPAGSLDIELFDMGATLPISGTTTLASGTQYTQIGDLGISGVSVSTFNLSLIGGVRRYSVEFCCGVAKEIISNQLLIPNNYYALVFSRPVINGNDVDLYGIDPLLETKYYNNGFCLQAPDNITPMKRIVPFNVLQVNTIVGIFNVGETINGGISLATANILSVSANAIKLKQFQNLETITGLTSGATGVVKVASNGKIDYTVTAGVFVANEIVTGSISLARTKITSVTPTLLTMLPFDYGETVTGLTSGATSIVDSISNILFFILSTQDIILDEITLKSDVPPGYNSKFDMIVEDANMKGILIASDETNFGQVYEEGMHSNPVFMEQGGKAEIYYSDGNDAVSFSTMGIEYRHKQLPVNG